MSFEKISNKLVDFFLIPLLVISICGSISLLPTLLQLVPNKAILCFVGLLILAYVGYSLIAKQTFLRILNKIKKPLLILLICSTLIWQFMLVRALSGKFGWDPIFFIGYIYRISSIINYDKIYFSLYPNNFMLLIMEKFFQAVFNIKTPNGLILGLNVLNILIIDVF